MLIRSLVTVMSHEEPVYSAGRNGWNVHELVVQLDKPERQQCAVICLLDTVNERQLTGNPTFIFILATSGVDPQ
jgi:hypothetical protein